MCNFIELYQLQLNTKLAKKKEYNKSANVSLKSDNYNWFRMEKNQSSENDKGLDVTVFTAYLYVLCRNNHHTKL